MRLHIFIRENMESILLKWDSYAREIWPNGTSDFADLRDHAEKMLIAISYDMQTLQSESEQHDKSVGNGKASGASNRLNSVSTLHAAQRLEAGFDIRALVAEYRALRTSVLQLWWKSISEISETQINDMTRFNECIDQLLAESVNGFSKSVEHSRELFLGILGHDLRTPMCAVSIMAGLLNENKDLNYPYREMASRIVVGTREMKRLVDELLEFAGCHMGMKLHIKREPMNLEELCLEVIEEIQVAHPTCVFDLERSGSGYGEWDRQRLRQLISNLLSNSVQHGGKDTPVRICMKTDGEVAEIEVHNQGPPIPPAMQDTIFDPMSSNTCDESAHRGLGLGLYIAREVVKAHDGSIEVHSDSRETAFLVKLPQRDTCGTHGDTKTISHEYPSVYAQV